MQAVKENAKLMATITDLEATNSFPSCLVRTKPAVQSRPTKDSSLHGPLTRQRKLPESRRWRSTSSQWPRHIRSGMNSLVTTSILVRKKKQETAKLTGKIADLEASLSFSAH